MSEKGRKLYNGITNIDDDLIMAALEAKPSVKAAPVKKKKPAMYYVYRWGGAAAAVIALAVVGILVVPMMTKNSESANYMTDSAPMYSANDSAVAEVDSDTCENTGSSYGIKDSETNGIESDYYAEETDEEYCSEVADASDVVLEEDQIYLDVDFDKVEEITLTYPGHDTVVIETSVAEEIVELVNSMGILSIKEDYQDVTTDEYATIEVEMVDGSVLEITPKYPYIFINGEVYECEGKARGIYNLALFINEFCKEYFGE